MCERWGCPGWFLWLLLQRRGEHVDGPCSLLMMSYAAPPLPFDCLHSLHRYLLRWCSQMLPPPHSLHRLLLRSCRQKLPPPHSLHWLLLRWCWQMLAPLHSLRWLLTRACWHMLAPPHSLHWLICRLCLHCLGLSPKSSCAAARFLRSIKIFWRSASTCGSIRRNRLCPREMLRVASRIHQMFPGSSTC